MKKHNRLWFKNRVGKKVYCNDHDKGDVCEGIMVDDDLLVVDNLLRSQNDRGIEFNHRKVEKE